ncbi:hypothetical protein GCM10012279_10090 [Micromonospora yangpuensis]|uniref:Uncharacterized protein n=1 Tax=Micromonospora yangpuensis TaxID=683228 RepID=A0A1C6UY92_9ACTN|nr:hypothetical protein GCM10012279_10090 [Micromonospora yangpuensis]SCL58770.1 hypothetical protein GA0070617_3910 [Micromonospora yangpuensis]
MTDPSKDPAGRSGIVCDEIDCSLTDGLGGSALQEYGDGAGGWDHAAGVGGSSFGGDENSYWEAMFGPLAEFDGSADADLFDGPDGVVVPGSSQSADADVMVLTQEQGSASHAPAVDKPRKRTRRSGADWAVLHEAYFRRCGGEVPSVRPQQSADDLASDRRLRNLRAAVARVTPEEVVFFRSRGAWLERFLPPGGVNRAIFDKGFEGVTSRRMLRSGAEWVVLHEAYFRRCAGEVPSVRPQQSADDLASDHRLRNLWAGGVRVTPEEVVFFRSRGAWLERFLPPGGMNRAIFDEGLGGRVGGSSVASPAVAFLASLSSPGGQHVSSGSSAHSSLTYSAPHLGQRQPAPSPRPGP